MNFELLLQGTRIKITVVCCLFGKLLAAGADDYLLQADNFFCYVGVCTSSLALFSIVSAAHVCLVLIVGWAFMLW